MFGWTRHNFGRVTLKRAKQFFSAPLSSPQPDVALYSRQFWTVLGAILLFCTLLKLPSLSFSHEEPDERIYLALAGHLDHAEPYNLSGTGILKELSSSIYDRPLFFHPPLFPVLLVPFIHANAERAAVIISWVGHLLCVLSVAVIGRRMMAGASCHVPLGDSFLWWLPVVGVALDPLLIFCSRRLWIDSLLCGLCAASIAAFVCARYSRRRPLWLVVGGVLLGLATLAKIPALVLGPLAVYLILIPPPEGTLRTRVRDLCLAGAPLFVLIVPWFVIFFHTYGVLLPSWIKPDEWTVEHYPFLKAVVARTPFYYLLKLILIAPVILVGLATYATGYRPWNSPLGLLPIIWFLLYFGAISYLGSQGMGFQMRYILPLVPSIYLALYPALSRCRADNGILPMILLLLLIYGGMTSAVYIITSRYDEVYSIPELVDWVRL